MQDNHVNRNMTRHRNRATAWAAAFILTIGSLAACGDDGPTGPVLDVALVAGTYNMTVLAFDPQGILPEVDVLAGLGTSPQLILSATGTAQIVYQDPTTSLFTTIAGSFRTTEAGVRLDFATNSNYGSLLLSRRMDFVFTSSPKRLTFDSAAPDGANRLRLIQLAPAFANEQLLDPVPGTLRVVFSS